MPLYHIRTHLVTVIDYAIKSDKELDIADVQNAIDKSSLAAMRMDFSQETLGEEVRFVREITIEQYIKLFDEKYPAYKDVDTTQKLFNIAAFPENLSTNNSPHGFVVVGNEVKFSEEKDEI